MDKKRCFVISPIGDPDSPEREHANDVLDFIIKPAMEECGIEAYRSDELQMSGKISEQMFDAILGEQICVAVLTGLNPNVFYELAIAQAARQPVIMMIEEGQSVPFDIQDWRCVKYTLKPRPLIEKVYVEAIIKHVHELKASGWKVKGQIQGFPPLANQSGTEDGFELFETSEEYGGRSKWLRLLKRTQSAFDIMGITLRSYKGKAFRDALNEKAKNGCKTRVLVMHPENPALPQLINTSLDDESLDDITQAAKTMYIYFADLAEEYRHFEVRQILRGSPHFQLVRSDQYAMTTLYLYRGSPNDGPLLRCPHGSKLYRSFADEFEAVWKANAPTSVGRRRRQAKTRRAKR